MDHFEMQTSSQQVIFIRSHLGRRWKQFLCAYTSSFSLNCFLLHSSALFRVFFETFLRRFGFSSWSKFNSWLIKWAQSLAFLLKMRRVRHSLDFCTCANSECPPNCGGGGDIKRISTTAFSQQKLSVPSRRSMALWWKQNLVSRVILGNMERVCISCSVCASNAPFVFIVSTLGLQFNKLREVER
jgi:hypothetical protein